MGWTTKKDRPTPGIALGLYLFISLFFVVRMLFFALVLMGLAQGFEKTFLGEFTVKLESSLQFQVIGAILFLTAIFMGFCYKAITEWKRWGIWGLIYALMFLTIANLICWYFPKYHILTPYWHIKEATYYMFSAFIFLAIIMPKYAAFDRGLPFQLNPHEGILSLEEGKRRNRLMKSLSFAYQAISESAAARMFKPKNMRPLDSNVPCNAVYNTARSETKEGKFDNAISCLARAVDMGFSNVDALREDFMMQTLQRKRPERFEQLVRVAERNAASGLGKS
jgi:hypothetical protein